MSKTVNLLATALLAGAVLTAAPSSRKVSENKLSPATSASITLGGHNILIEYSAPSARNRKVEGGLIPYGQPWRTGADAATTLTTGADIMIGDLRVPKGTYTLYTLAKEGGDWKLIVNKQTGQWGTEYSEGQDLGRTSLTVKPLNNPVETLKIDLRPSGSNAATLAMKWGMSEASVPIQLAQ